MEQLVFSLNATVPVFLVMVLGYLLRRLHVVDEHFVKVLNSFNFKITLPVLLFRDIAESDFYSVWDGRYVAFCFLVSLLCILLLWIFSRLFYRDRDRLGEFVQASYRSSAAVLGIAFITNIYGNAGMAPLMIIGTVPLYNVASVIILSFTGPGSKGLDKKALSTSIKGILTNPIIIGILLGMGFSAFQVPVLTIPSKVLGSVASLATPLALIGLGAGFDGQKAIKLFRPTCVISFCKLVLFPVIFLPLAIYLGFTNEKLVAILIMLGSPTTVSSYIMCKNMGHAGVLTSGAVVMTTCLSAVTLSFFLFILRYMALI